MKRTVPLSFLVLEISGITCVHSLTECGLVDFIHFNAKFFYISKYRKTRNLNLLKSVHHFSWIPAFWSYKPAQSLPWIIPTGCICLQVVTGWLFFFSSQIVFIKLSEAWKTNQLLERKHFIVYFPPFSAHHPAGLFFDRSVGTASQPCFRAGPSGPSLTLSRWNI